VARRTEIGGRVTVLKGKAPTPHGSRHSSPSQSPNERTLRRAPSVRTVCSRSGVERTRGRTTQMTALESTATVRARVLLENLRRSPMTRGNSRLECKRILREAIAWAIQCEAVPERLGARIALQLVMKFEPRDLGGLSTWRAIGQLLREEIDRLQNHLGLVERQMVVALPKLSARQIEGFFAELKASDASIARTILNAALDAADPLTTGRRYLAEFQAVVKQFQRLDAGIARTFANATFMAHAPRAKAMAHFERFADLMMRFRGDVNFVRTVARAAFRAPDPIKAAESFVADYDAIVAQLTAEGVEPSIARSLAGIASVGAEPRASARKLLENFEAVLRLAKKTHPGVARSIALSACRSRHPVDSARVYMKNYDRIVKAVSRTDARRAHRVAAQAFRTNKPMRWANRYLAEIQKTG
jgi:hypothetical protein